MRVIINSNTNPYFNLAFEEHLLKETNDEIFMLWQNKSSVVVGRNQNTAAEVDTDKARTLGVEIVRRETGGGAVYHDLGNLNYSFISNDPNSFLDFQRFATPVLNTLKRLGVNAELSGRNDLLIDGKKFSGNAQMVYKNRLLHHGTLLFDTDLSALSTLLTVDPDKIQSKGISSTRSRVTNILPHLKDRISLVGFANLIADCVINTMNDAEISSPTDSEISAAERLKSEKYDTWEWNFGFAPPYSFHKKSRIDCGTIEVYLDVKDGIITSTKIYGDFFGTDDITYLEQSLVGLKHHHDDIEVLFDKTDVSRFFGNITKKELLGCFF